MIDYTSHVLTVEERTELQPTVDLLREKAPEIMSRKFPEAVFQQAWSYKFWMDHKESIPEGTTLIIGSYDDPVADALLADGVQSDCVDPEVNGLTLHDAITKHILPPNSYAFIFANSVLEHVENDHEFVSDICNLLIPGGYGLLTLDYDDSWVPGKPLPPSDYRLYTRKSLLKLTETVKTAGGKVVEANWSPVSPYFYYAGILYSFATIVITKDEDVQL